MKTHSPYTVVLMLVLCAVTAMAQDPAPRMDRYNVVWGSAGADATDSMPIGNGDLAANVHVIEGDAIYLLPSKSDAFDWRGSLIKCGRVHHVQVTSDHEIEVRAGLEERFRQYSTHMRFPIFGRETPDHVPDFDHNGSGSVALEKILNEARAKSHFLPAWPKQWDTGEIADQCVNA